MPTVNFSPLEAAATDAEATVEDAAAEDAEEEPPQAERAATAPQAAAAVRKERRVILRILMISSISSPCSQQDAALRADIVSGSIKVRFTLVKYITESLAKQSTFTRKRPLLSIQVKSSINYFEQLFRFF
jgi:acyl-CoA reductase-like NAD-dependent aldehyde dehydrogenase